MTPRFTAAAFSCLILGLPSAACGQAGTDVWSTIGRTLGTSNVSTQPYHRYNLPRTDLALRIGDIDASAIGLGAWVGFSGPATDAIMMGDLVVTAEELAPVLAELARQTIDVSAIHNHFAGETPQVYYVHLYGQGNAEDLARRVEGAVALTATPRPVSAPVAQPAQIDTATIFRGLGRSGSASGSVARVSFQLIEDDVTLAGRTVDPAMGLSSPIVIQMVGANRAVATGDFAVRGSAVPAVVRALAEADITATAVHSHLHDESPPVRYIHFWGDGPLAAVVQGLRSALDAAR